MSSTKNILIMLSNPFLFTQKQLDLVKTKAKDYNLVIKKSDEVTDGDISKAEVIYGWPKADNLDQAENLKWLHVPSAGVDRYADKSKYVNKDIILSNSSGTFGKPMAEHAISLIFAFNRNLHRYVKNQRIKKWERYHTARDFFNSTVGVVGLGDIGSEVAKRSHALGAKVVAVKRTATNKPEYVDELYTSENIDKLLKKADSVVLALPNTEKTRGIISAERINMMKENAFIVNLGRGSAIDQNALIKALKEQRIAGAGLDVTTPEPLPEDNPLWDMPNVIITSHTSGLSPTSKDRNIKIFTDNLEKYIAGKNLDNTVNFKEGY